MLCSGMARFVRVVAHAASSTIHHGSLIVVYIYNHNVCTITVSLHAYVNNVNYFVLFICPWSHTVAAVQRNKLL